MTKIYAKTSRKEFLKNPVIWNPWNKVVQDHRDGTIDYVKTDRARKARGLPTPWAPEMAERECHEPAVE